MGTFYEAITLENSRDRAFAESGYLKDDQIRAVDVEAMPDTGAWTLVINEEVRQKLGLKKDRPVKSSMADGATGEYDLTEPVGISWKNRHTIQQAVVVPTAKDILLGALPLEALDLCVDPVNKRLVGIHGENPLYVIY